MHFTLDIFRPDFTGEPPAIPTHLLRSGHWLVEADSCPPAEHQPTRLLADRAGPSGLAISLTSATVLEFNLVSALASALAAEGCRMPEPYAELALHEVLLNAVVHGNLGVATGRASAWRDLAARESMIAAALAQPALAARLVTLAIGWDAERIVAMIADEGAGFIQSDAAAGLGNPSAAGRGLLIARAAADVETLDGGRCTKLEFRRQSAAVSV